MAQTVSESRLRIFGTSEKTAAIRVIKAGPLSVELSGAALGAIRYKGIEVLRGISYLVRDENWGTCAASITAVKITETNERFRISFSAKASKGESTLTYSASIEASPKQLTFNVSATPDRDFRTNRTGFVVLHPINGVAGKPVTVTHIDGTKTRSKFPKYISPGQPFLNIRALEHAPIPGLKAHVLMEGNKFEMEDQRNWSDASFKTYVCSLLDPWPYVLRAGERFEQSVTLTITGDTDEVRSPAAPVAILHSKPNARLPEIGLKLSEEDANKTLQHIDRLRELSPSFLLCSYIEGWTTRKTLDEYAAIGRATGIPLRLEVVLTAMNSAADEMRSVAVAMKLASINPRALTVTHAHDLKSFQPTDVRPWGPSYGEMANAARDCFPNIPIGGGMASYFTEFNRKPPPRGVFDFLTHSICPIVHDASDAAVMQTLETLPHIFASAKAIIGETPYHLGPTTIAARMNPYGKDVSANPDNRRTCLAPNDPRQFGEFAASWNLGLLAAAAKAGVKSVTLGSLCGPRGLLDTNSKPTALFDFLADLMPFGGKRLTFHAAEGLVGLTVPRPAARHIWFGNTTSVPHPTTVKGVDHNSGPYQVSLVNLT